MLQASRPSSQNSASIEIGPVMSEIPSAVRRVWRRVVLRINMELCRASDVMSTITETIHSQENVAKLAKILLRTEHGAFPVVKYDEETQSEIAYGLITRPVQTCSLYWS